MKITRRQLKQIIAEITSREESDPWASNDGTNPRDSWQSPRDGRDNDGDGIVDEDDENYFMMGGTVSELITYLQGLDGGLPVSCYLGEGPYLTKETTCSFAVLQPGDGTEEVEIAAPTFAIICES